MKFVVFKKKVFLIVSLLLLVIILSSMTVGIVSATSKEKRLLPIYSVDRSDKKIAISFDCAWGADYTENLLSIMKEKGVKCTFFAVSFWVEKYPELVKKIVDMGHEMGTHSKTHPHMSKLSSDKIREELVYSMNAIEKITNKKVEVFRPPFGDYSNDVISVAKSLNLFTIQWDVDSLDWKNLSANEIYDRVIKKVKNGSIVLFHNNGLHTEKALPKILDKLLNDGFEFTTISELIYKDNYFIDTNGRQFAVKNS